MREIIPEPITQVGYLVCGIEGAMARWTERLGIGPWTLFRNVRLVGRFRDEPAIVTMNVGLAYQGQTQIELIEVTNEGPSPYRDEKGRIRLGMHHIAWLVDDLDETVETMTKRGLSVLFSAESPGTRVAYLESPEDPGILYEYIESETTRALIAEGIAASREWTGSGSVRMIDLAGTA